MVTKPDGENSVPLVYLPCRNPPSLRANAKKETAPLQPP